MSMSGQRRVLIIGGGFAGLGCLKTLKQYENFSVTLLEASDHLGGRIETIRLSNSAILELGATYIHGEEGNSLYQIAQELGMARKTCGDSVNSICLLSNGEQVDEAHLHFYGDIITDIFEELVSCAEKNDWSYVLHPDKKEWQKANDIIASNDLSQYVRERFRCITSQCDTQAPLEAIVDHWLLREAVINGTSYSRGVDTSSYNEFCFPLGDQNILLSSGYEGLVKAIAADVEPLCVYNKRVCSIDWGSGGDAPIVVYCDDHSHYEADHVILTVSLGVLKSHTLLFNPPLPPWKQEAVSKLGMAITTKVILTFPSPLLSNVERVSFLWCNEDRSVLAQTYPWAVFIYRMNCIRGTQSWVFWFAEEEAKTIEQLLDSELAMGICKAIELFLRRPVATPTSIRRARWGLNELFAGSYSYNCSGSSKHDREVLTKPVGAGEDAPLQLLFAGEATNQNLYSTTNGAYDTGVREANRLINYYQHNNQ